MLTRKYLLPAAGALLLTLVLAALWLCLPPSNFPVQTPITVKKGSNLASTTALLVENNAIRSELAFKLFVILSGNQRNLQAGRYWFERPLAVWRVAWRLGHGYASDQMVRVTIPEGLSNAETIEALVGALPTLDPEELAREVEGLEGKLFPDTYFFPHQVSEGDVVEMMTANFDRNFEPYTDDLDASGHNLTEILTMASILEKEASTLESRQVISGILWKRIKAGQPLQVDAPFAYLDGVGRSTFELTKKDLKIDSPYNTYKNKGLPPAPIVNPGIDAIVAALKPVDSPYWFYLSDRSGGLHYAKTFAEHKQNRVQYLNS